VAVLETQMNSRMADKCIVVCFVRQVLAFNDNHRYGEIRSIDEDLYAVGGTIEMDGPYKRYAAAHCLL
jgi:hypothetical protein